MKNGSIAKAWNDTVVSEDKPYVARDYLWASELGNSDIDVYLRMQGEQPSNRPDIRSKRKFDVGNLFEGIVANILDRAGVVTWLAPDDKRVMGQEPGMLRVSGRFDILLDGKADLEKAIAESKKELESLKVDDPYLEYQLGKSIKLCENLIASGEEIIFDKVIAEVKSMSLFMYNAIEGSGKPVDTHAMQLYHYVKYNKIGASPIGRLFCVCRDDIRLSEFSVFDKADSRYAKMYMESLKRKTDYYNAGKMPPKEPMLVVKEGKVSTNFNVGYSGYLTKLYGYGHTEEYRDEWSKVASSWNRVTNRITKGDNMTANNLEKIGEMKAHFGEKGYDDFIKQAIKASQKAYAIAKAQEVKGEK